MTHRDPNPPKSLLLAIDGALNLLFGIILLLFPFGVPSLLGLPSASSAFYPMILGAVLFGIGVALLVERQRGAGGLGIHGAIVINLSGGGALLLWLMFGDLDLPAHGMALLWTVAVAVLGLSVVEWRRL